MSDSLQERAAKKAAFDRRRRERICLACVRPDDVALGLIHSDLACARCGVKPCYGIVTAGPVDALLKSRAGD